MRWILFTAFLSSSAMALPVFVENGAYAIFTDHEDPKLIYYMPDTGAVKLDKKNVPMFGMAWWNSEGKSIYDGELVSTYELIISYDMERRLSEYEEKGFRIKLLPLKQSYIKSSEKFISELNAPSFIRPEESFTIKARTHESASIAKTYSGGKSFNPLFDYCYNFEGLSPELKSDLNLNDYKIQSYFWNKLGKKRISKAELDHELGQYFVSLEVVLDSPYWQTFDITSIVRNYFLEHFFIQDGDRYVLDTNKKFPDEYYYWKLEGRYPVSKSLCLTLSENPVIGRKELFNYVPGL